MSSRATALLLRRFFIVSLTALAVFGYGCDNDSESLSARFTASATPPAVNLVKLTGGASSGSRVIVHATIFGPSNALDLYAVDFHVTIGDPDVLRFVAGTAVAGGALTASAGQTVVATASADAANPGDVTVSVHKTGGGLGNGIPGTSAILVSLTFEAVMAGTSTLAIAGSPAPTARDSGATAIGAISFDTAPASVAGVNTGGGPY